MTPVTPDELARRYLPAAIAIARRQIVLPEYKDEADSLAGEALAEAIQKYRPPPPGCRDGFLPLLRRAVRFKVIDFIRHRRTEQDKGACRSEPARWAGKAYEVQYGEDEAFERRLAPLPSHLANLLRLIYRDGLNQPEAARQIGKAKSRVSRLHAEALAVLAGGPAPLREGRDREIEKMLLAGVAWRVIRRETRVKDAILRRVAKRLRDAGQPIRSRKPTNRSTTCSRS
jgi:RNA polymerase sigma factor (sigma-70 family)